MKHTPSPLNLNPGDRIACVAMIDDQDPIEEGTEGTVDYTNYVDLGLGFWQIGVRWDNGRKLMLSVPPDRFRRL